MKQIYILNEKSRAIIYGIGTYIKQLTDSLVLEESFSLHIVNFNSDQKDFLFEEKDRIKYYYLPQISTNYNSQRYYRNSFFILQPYIETKKMKDNNDLIFHFNFYQEIAFIKIIKEYYPESKIVFTIHYFNWCFLIKGNMSYFRRIIKNNPDNLIDNVEKGIAQDFQEIKKIFELTDKIVCLSKFTKQTLIKLYETPKDKIVTIYNGLKDDATFLSKKDKISLKTKLHIGENEKIILFVGRLDEAKGVDIVINSFKRINQFHKDFNCRLIIVGDGDYNRYIKECKDIWGKVIFTGLVNKETLYQFYQIADVGVMPSTHEQCSFVAIEMFSHGIPLIASTTTGLNEMMCTELRYLKLKAKEMWKDTYISVEECVNNIMLVFKQTEEEKKIMIDLSRKHYLKNYSLNKMKKKVISLYK